MRLLLVRLSALGDIVHTWPLAVALKEAMPQLELTWAVEEPLLPLVQDHPAVDRAVSTATRRWRRRPADPTTGREISTLRSTLRYPRQDICFDPQGTVKSASVCRLSRAGRRIGLDRPWRREFLAGLAYTETVRPLSPSPHVVATNLELLRAVGIRPPGEPPPPNGRWLLGRSPNPLDRGHVRPYAVILPGTGHPSKIVPEEVLGRTAQGLAVAGLCPVVAWGPGERARADRVVAAAGADAVLAPPTGLLELASLLGDAALVVGGDTGPVHLAASLGTPTVAVFMATDPLRNGPLGPRTRVVSTVPREPHRPTGRARVGPGPPPTSSMILEAVNDLLHG